MILLLIADLHNFDTNLPEKLRAITADVCVTLGDIPPDILGKIRKFLPRTTYGIYGNHDEYNLQKYKIETFSADVSQRKNTTLKSLTIPEFKAFGKWLFAGIDGSHKYKNGELPTLSTHEESVLTAKFLACQRYYLPQNAKNENLILFSHDKYFRQSKDPVNSGLKGIKWFIKNEQPKYHFYGHYHAFNVQKIYKTKSFCIYGAAIFNTETGELKKV